MDSKQSTYDLNEQPGSVTSPDVSVPSTSSGQGDVKQQSVFKLVQKTKTKKKFTVLKRKRSVTEQKLSDDKKKIASMPFYTRSGKERMRPSPLAISGRSQKVTQPTIGAQLLLRVKAELQDNSEALQENICSDSQMTTIPVESPSNSGMSNREHSADVCLNSPSVAGDTQIEDATLELEEDEGEICVGDEGANEDVDEDEVVCVSPAPVAAVLARDKKKAIVMPGHKTKKSTSYVWNYFYPNPDNNCIAICSVCEATVSRGRDLNHLGTSSMLRHLTRVHGKVLGKAESSSQKNTSTPSSAKTLRSPTYRRLQNTPTTPSSSISSVALGVSPASHLRLDDSGTIIDSSEESVSPAAAVAAAGGESSSQRQVNKMSSPTFQQLTVKQSFARGSKYDSSHPVAKRITDAMAAMLVLDLRPISTINAAGFSQLIEVLCPRYRIPSRHHFSRKAIPQLYQKVCKNVEIALKNAILPTVHLTTDMWTSGSGQTKDYMTVTAHWVGHSPSPAGTAAACTPLRNICHRQATLCITGFTNRHTADNLLRKLRDVIDAWLIPLGLSPGYVISDNANNIVRALQLGDFQHIPCFAHTINLVVQSFLRNNREVQEMLSVARKISGHFRHSATACRRLQQLQEQFNLPCHQLKQEVVTRWNSTLYMLQRMEEQRKAIQAYCTSHDIGKGGGMYFTLAQWGILSVLCKVLKPFEVVTCEVSADSASLSQVIPLIRLLEKQLEKMKEELKASNSAKYVGLVDQVLNSLHNDPRVIKILNSDQYVLATVLDPRFKTYIESLLVNERDVNFCKELLLSKLAAELGLGLTTCPPSLSQAVARKKLNFQKRSREDTGGRPEQFNIWAGLKDFSKKCVTLPITPSNMSINMQRMVEDYFQEVVDMEMSDSPFPYWEEKQAIWKPMYKLALQYLSCPPSSVYSERVFSTAGNLVSDRRRRLLPKNVEKMMFIKMNYIFHEEGLHHPRHPSTDCSLMADSSGDELIVCDDDVHTDEGED